MRAQILRFTCSPPRSSHLLEFMEGRVGIPREAFHGDASLVLAPRKRRARQHAGAKRKTHSFTRPGLESFRSCAVLICARNARIVRASMLAHVRNKQGLCVMSRINLFRLAQKSCRSSLDHSSMRGAEKAWVSTDCPP